MGNNLPPGVTPADIDKQFGSPERETVIGEVTVTVGVQVPKHSSEKEKKQALMDAVADEKWDDIIEAEIVEIR